MAVTNFPNDALCYILVDFPGIGEFKATGAIIGPHTILTAAHLVYNADIEATADQISIYPNFRPENGTYNPPGALPGLQSIHTIKVNDSKDKIGIISAQSDFAVINTSTDLSCYGYFALDPEFTSGYAVVAGYPASNNGYLLGTGGSVTQNGTLSDLDISNLTLSPGDSGAPIQDVVERNGAVLPAIAGTVSTGKIGMKLNKAKIALIRHWIASDRDLYTGGDYAPKGLVPQIAGTVSKPSGSAMVPLFTYTAASAEGGDAASSPVLASGLAALAQVIQSPSPGTSDITFVPTNSEQGATIAGPLATFRPNQGFSTGS